MAQNPTLVPAYLDMTKFNNSIALLANLQAKREQLLTLCQSLDDTIATVSHFIYGDERAFYDSVGQAAKRPSGASPVRRPFTMTSPRSSPKARASRRRQPLQNLTSLIAVG